MENTSQASRRFPAKTTKWRETRRPSWLVVISPLSGGKLIGLTIELRNGFSIGRAKRLADSRWLASRSPEEIWFGKWFSMLSYISFIENTVLKTWNSFTIVFTLFTFLLSRDFTTQAESVTPYLGYTLNKTVLTPIAQRTKIIFFLDMQRSNSVVTYPLVGVTFHVSALSVVHNAAIMVLVTITLFW